MTTMQVPAVDPAQAGADDRRLFPTLAPDEMDLLRREGCIQHLSHGEVAYRAGEADVDFFAVECGGLEVLNPMDDDAHIVTHGPGQFVGDIDLLTRRPVIVTVRADGPTTVVRVPGAKLRHLLNTVPKLSEKVLVAFQVRRARLAEKGVAGARIMGPAGCRETTEAREFLYRNFVPSVWIDTTTDDGRRRVEALAGPKPRTPVIDCGAGRVLKHPNLHQLADAVGIWQGCPTETFDLAVVGLRAGRHVGRRLRRQRGAEGVRARPPRPRRAGGGGPAGSRTSSAFRPG